MKNNYFQISLFFVLVFSISLQAQEIKKEKFEPTDKSLQQYKYPDWFRDAKFGIWAHWGPQAVPRQGDWYARNMYCSTWTNHHSIFSENR